MEDGPTLFDLFGGIRPMARTLGEKPSTVMSWKNKGRIPAEKQPHVLHVGISIGLPISASHVMYPLGIPASLRMAADIAGHIMPVACDPQAISQSDNDA